MALFLLVVLVVQVAHPVSSTPTISFPFNSQLPPAARIDQLFSYSFSPYTFKSDSSITYSLGDHPTWLSIEGSSRRLYGIPEDKDIPQGAVTGQPVEIIATDSDGSTAMNSTLVVSRNKAPFVQIPVSQQIRHFGEYSAPSSLLSYPSKDFSYSFASNTFSDEQGEPLNYYAVSADSSPLPAWIKFDAPSLTLSGRTPPFETLIQPPQTFGLEIVASDIAGFSAASISFSIVVGSHKLSADTPTITLNTTRGSKLDYKDLGGSIKLDGNEVAPRDLDVTTDHLPGWLSVDPDTLEIKGTPGPKAHSTNFTIQFHDAYADTLKLNAIVNVGTGLFASTFGDIHAEPGEKLNIDLAPHFRDPTDVEITAKTDPKAQWLKIDGLKISGTVPESASGQLSVSITAKSKSSGAEETEKLNVRFVDAIATLTASPTGSMSATSTTAHPTGTKEGVAEKDRGSGTKNFSTTALLLAIILPIVAIILGLMVLICCIRRRRHGKSYLSSSYRNNISNPFFGTPRSSGSVTYIRHGEKPSVISQTETQMFKPAERGYMNLASQHSEPSTSSSSSESSGSSRSALPMDSAADVPRPNTGKSAATEDGGKSWFTLEGTMTRHSDVTVSGSMHQVLPTPDFLTEAGNTSFREGLDWTIPSIDDLPSLQPTPNIAYVANQQVKKQRSTDLRSMMTSSSEALPPSRRGSQAYKSGAPQSKKEHDQEPLNLIEEDTVGNLSTLQRPSQARLSSQQWASRKDGQAQSSSDSSRESKSFRTDTDVSFGSSENWRVIGRRRGEPPPRSGSYRDLVDEAPFNPLRATRTMSGGRSSGGEDLLSPSKWAEGRAKTEEPEASSLGKDKSGKVSKGSSEGSFKVFL